MYSEEFDPALGLGFAIAETDVVAVVCSGRRGEGPQPGYTNERSGVLV